MKKGGQKAKANRHQNIVCKIFDGVYYPDGDGEFRSTPASGGWDKRIAPGDVQPFVFRSRHSEEMIIDQSFPFSIECKDWKDENVKHIFSGLYSQPSQIYGWLEQSMYDAKASGRIPLVVFKLYRTENIVLMHQTDWAQLRELFGRFGVGTYKVMGGPYSIVFALLKDFIKWVDWGWYKYKHSRKNYISSLEKREDTNLKSGLEKKT